MDILSERSQMRLVVALTLLFGAVSGAVATQFFPADGLLIVPLSLLVTPFAACKLGWKPGGEDKGMPTVLVGATLGATAGYTVFLLVSLGAMDVTGAPSRLSTNPSLWFQFVGPAISLCGFASRGRAGKPKNEPAAPSQYPRPNTRYDPPRSCRARRA